MGVGEIAGLIAAIAFAVLAGFMIYPLIRLGKMLIRYRRRSGSPVNTPSPRWTKA